MFEDLFQRHSTGKQVYLLPYIQTKSHNAHIFLSHVSFACPTQPQSTRVIVLVLAGLLTCCFCFTPSRSDGQNNGFCKTLYQLTVAGQLRIFTLFPFNLLHSKRTKYDTNVSIIAILQKYYTINQIHCDKILFTTYLPKPTT